MNSEKKSFWTSLPGVLTGIAALITALTTLYLTINHDVPQTPTPSPILSQPPEKASTLKTGLKWKLVGEDTFTSTNSKWSTGSFTNSGGFKRFDAKMISGKFRFDFETYKKAIRIFDAPYGAALQYRFSINVRMVDFDSNEIIAGLLFGQRSGIGYQFSILPTGQWAVRKDNAINNTNTVVIEWTSSELDPKKWNTLEVEVDENRVQLRINSQIVGTYKDSNLSGGTVGIFVAAGVEKGMAVIDFDNFQYYRKENS